MSTRETKLTSNICNNHFKTALRSNNDEFRYRDVKRIGFDRPKVKKIVDQGRSDIFNDQYQNIQKNIQMLREKYMNTYVKDTLKSTLYPGSVNKGNQFVVQNGNLSSINKISKEKNGNDRFSNKKLKDEIINSTPGYTILRKVPSIEKFYNDTNSYHMRRQSVKRIDTNPIRSLSCEEINEDIRMERLKRQNKEARVNGYMGSENFKSCTYNGYAFSTATDSNTKSTINDHDYNKLTDYKINKNDFKLFSSQKKQISQLNYETEPSIKHRKNSSFIF